MFGKDSHLDEFSERHLLVNPTFGLAYQIQGAFMRLQKKTLTLTETETPSDPKLAGVDWVYWSLDQHLGLGLTPRFAEVEKEWNTLRAWADRFSQMKFVVFVPKTITSEVLAQIQQMAPERTLIFRCPPTFGFRDRGLFEASQNEKFLKADLELQREFIFSGDLSALAISWSHLEKNVGTQLEVPGLLVSWKDWATFFEKHFSSKEKKSLWQRLGFFQNTQTQKIFENMAEGSKEAQANTEFWDKFPTALTRLDRAFQYMSRSLERSPEAEWVMPAPRSP